MPELPEVTQEFTADVAPYLAGIEEMIAATDQFRESVDAALIAVEALHAAIDDLPDVKVINIRVETTGNIPEAAAAAAGTEGAAPDTAGMAAEAAAEDAVGDAADEADAKVRLLTEAEDASAAAALRDAAAQEALRAATEDAGAGFGRASENANSLDDAFARLDEILKEQGGDWEEVDVGAGRAAESLDEVGLSYREMVEQGILPADSALRGAGDAADETRAAYESLIDQGLDPADAAWAAQYTRIGATSEALSSAGDAALTDAEHLAAVGDAADHATVPFTALGLAAQDATTEFERIGEASDGTATGFDAAAFAAAEAAKSVQDAGTAAKDSGTAAQGASWGWGFLTQKFTLWAGVFGDTALIGHVAGWHIALDGVFEAAVAVGTALAALSLGLAAMAPAAQDIYNHLTSVHDVSVALGVTIPPLTGWFEQLQHQMAPQTVEAYGGALNLLSGNMGGLTHIVQEVVTGLDDWIAKLDMWKASQKSTDGILQDGVGFLHQFEQVLNNVGMAIANLIKADPGTAHFLMDAVVGFSKLLDIVTSIPAPILETVLALHSIDIWGGLAVTQIVKLGTGLFNFGQSLVTAGAGLVQFLSKIGLLAPETEALVIPMNDLRTAEAGAALESDSLASRFALLAASPWTWAIIAAAAIAALGYASVQADSGVHKFIGDLTSGINSLPPSQAITAIASAVGQLNAQIKNVSISQVAGEWNNLGHTMSSFGDDARAVGTDYAVGLKDITSGQIISGLAALGKGLEGVFVPGQGEAIQAKNNVEAYKGAIVQLTGEQANLFGETGNLIKQGYTYQQSLALMDLAGVQTGDSLALMKQKVQNLITGYQNMGVQGGMLANSVNAVTFATEQQNSKITALTQGWTAFISTVTGGESAFITAEQGIYGIASAATSTGATLTVSNGKTTLATAATAGLGSAATSTAAKIGGLSQNSLQLTSTYQTAITNGSSLINSLLMQSSAAGMGAKGYALVSQGAKDYLQQLVPMAKGNQLATAELYALAQQAGYTGTDSFQALSKWIGNTSNSGENLQGVVTKLTVASAGLTTDMNNLADAISGNLNQAMAAAIVQAEGGQKAFDTFATAAVRAHGTTDGMTSAATSLAQELIRTTGNTNSAHSMFDTFSISLGLSKQQADQLWSAVERTAGGLNNASNAANRTTGAVNASAGAMYRGADAALAMANAVNDIPNYKGVLVNVQEAITGTVGVGGILPTPSGHAAGFRVPGYGGGDVHPAMLEGGEAVVPKHLTPTVAPFLKAHGVPGFADGGVMGSDGGYGGFGGGGDRPIHVHVEMNGTQVASALIPSLTAANGRYAVRNSGKATGVWKPV